MKKIYYIITMIGLLGVITSCDDEELYKTVVAEEPDVTFNFYDTDGNPSERGSNAWRIENPILSDENATDADLNFDFISEFVIPEGVTIDSVIVQYQTDFVFSNGGSNPQGWVNWETVNAGDDRWNGNRLTYSFNIQELNVRYWGGAGAILTTGCCGIVKDNNNARMQLFLSDGRDLISAKVVFWYPVVPGDPE